MKILASYGIGKLHDLIIRHILEKGYLIVTENGEYTLETEDITLFTNTPLSEPMCNETSPIKREFLDKYTEDLLYGTSSNFEYDYHTRLFNWGKNSTLFDICDVNQIEYILTKLTVEQNSRRAQAITWIPQDDINRNDCPCLQYIQCKIRNNKLNMTVLFRSNDMLLAAGANMYALVQLQKYILNTLNEQTSKNYEMGSYTHISTIPHVYFIRDANNLIPYKDCLRKNLYLKEEMKSDPILKEKVEKIISNK